MLTSDTRIVVNNGIKISKSTFNKKLTSNLLNTESSYITFLNKEG